MTSITTPSPPASGRSQLLVAVPIRFDRIPRAAWDRLLAATAAATPFSRWTFHRAWWDAYGATSHEEYLVCVEAATAGDGAGPPALAADGIRAIVPLMHRHEVEPTDAATATLLRRHRTVGTGVRPDAKAVFMGASYHADYATLLAASDDVDAVAAAVAHALAGPPDPAHGDMPWDVVDLRRLRDDDPALPALERAFREAAGRHGWGVLREPEDVCPVVTLTTTDWEAYLGTLDKKARHEIRRKIRRAETTGPVRFEPLPLTAESVDAFIDLHQARWGPQGLFPPTEGGARSRRFMHRLAELEAADGDRAQLQLCRVSVGERVIFIGVGFDDGTTCHFYNAGLDPAARELSPGVTGTAAYLRDRLEAGRRRMDFMRGNEPYKYEWGAVDEPIHRLLVARGG